MPVEVEFILACLLTLVALYFSLTAEQWVAWLREVLERRGKR